MTMVAKLKYCPTSDMIADMLAKLVYTDTFTKLRYKLGLSAIRPPPVPL